MPEPKPTRKGTQPKKKAYESQADAFLEGLQIVPARTDETDPKQAGQPEGKPVVVNKLIDFIKKM